MGLTVFVIAVALTGLGLLTMVGAGTLKVGPVDSYGARRSERDLASVRTGARILGLLLVLAGLSMTVLDSYTIVGARTVAVQTAFGKVQGDPLGAGWHWVAPWHNIEKFDASVQTLRFYKDEKDDDGTCITVRLGNNTSACVDVTTQWSINHNGNVNELYLKYKTFDNIHNNLVTRQLQSALNEVFGSYDPLAALGAGTDTPNTNTKELQTRVHVALAKDLGTFILIDSVTIPIVHFDGPTEDRLKAYQQAKADTRIAEQGKLTAKAQADAAKLLAEQPGIEKDGVRYQNCLNLIADLAQKDQLRNLPPTWNCATAPNGAATIIATK